MLITVTQTSQDLDTILSQPQKDIFNKTKYSDSSTGYHKFFIQNLGAVDIYAEFGADALVAEGAKIEPNDYFPFNDMKFNDLNLISDGADNTNIRIIAN